MQNIREISSVVKSGVPTFDAPTAVLYGQLIEVAYQMFNANSSNQTPTPPQNLPGGYRFVAWVLMQDFLFGNTTPLLYGIIVQSPTNPNQFVLALRGTSTWIEWWDDLKSIELVTFKDPGGGRVGAGFAKIYDTLEIVYPSTTATAVAAPQSLKTTGGFAKQMAELVNRHTAPVQPGALPASASMAVVGHSLGAALATLYVLDNALTQKIDNPTICTFASPRVGDATFANAFDTLDLASWRIVNFLDLVPHLPLGYTHIKTLIEYNSGFSTLPTPGCWHSLATYLSLIDPSLKPESGCQWPALAMAPSASAGAPQSLVSAFEATPFVPPTPTAATQTIPAGPVNVNITINVDVKE